MPMFSKVKFSRYFFMRRPVSVDLSSSVPRIVWQMLVCVASLVQRWFCEPWFWSAAMLVYLVSSLARTWAGYRDFLVRDT